MWCTTKQVKWTTFTYINEDEYQRTQDHGKKKKRKEKRVAKNVYNMIVFT